MDIGDHPSDMHWTCHIDRSTSTASTHARRKAGAVRARGRVGGVAKIVQWTAGVGLREDDECFAVSGGLLPLGIKNRFNRQKIADYEI